MEFTLEFFDHTSMSVSKFQRNGITFLREELGTNPTETKISSVAGSNYHAFSLIFAPRGAFFPLPLVDFRFLLVLVAVRMEFRMDFSDGIFHRFVRYLSML